MFALCNWMDKEGDIYGIEIVVRMNRLTGWRKEKEAEWLAGNLKTEAAPFSSAEIGDKEFSFEDRDRRQWTGKSHAKLRAKGQSRGFLDSSWCDKMNWNCRQNSGEKRKESWTRRTGAFKPSCKKIPASP